MIQLRIRTEYSFGQTFAPIDRVVETLKGIECEAAGIVDNDTWGHVAFHTKCRAAGIKPLLGVELVVTDLDDQSPHMWFLARNVAGLQELYRLTSLTFKQPVAGKRGSIPALRRTDVLNMSDNIIKFAGDIVDEAFLNAAGAIADLSPASRVLNLKKTSLGLPIVAVGDNAYCLKEDVGTFEFVSGNMKPSAQHILTELEHQEEAKRIADMCEDYDLPKAPMVRAKGDLAKLCRDGIAERNIVWTDEYEERLNRELTLIHEKDFESYFILVADMVRYAKQHMLVGPSRGSSAGSLVCYLTRITEVDPIPPGLFFERFIDVSRADLPDIDLDFPDTKRFMIFDYMAEKYGFENAAHIGTISRFKPKSALVQVCKKLNIPPFETTAVKVAMIERSVADQRASNCLLDTLNTTEPGKRLVAAYPSVLKAAEIEGHASHTGVHAAGLLISNEPITNYATVDANGIAHIEKGAAEILGLLKIDVLGLRTLGVLEDSGVNIDWYGLKFDDPKVYEIFNQGKMCGIFQFDGQALRQLSHEITFETMRDIDGITALARPGPFAAGIVDKWLERRNGKPYQKLHPRVEELLEESYGLPLYQEQTMSIVRSIGQFDWKDTSYIRKAVSKRLGAEYFGTFFEKYMDGARRQGIPDADSEGAWNMIQSMGAWQMNKAHTWSYAVISYWTAYLKTYHPLEFAAANLRNAPDEDSAVQLLREMVNEGIKYVAFDKDKSEANWSAKEGVLYGGVSSLFGFGEVKAAKFIEDRENGTLSQKTIGAALSAPSVFADIFPFRTRYGHMYDDPDNNGIGGKLYTISEFDGTQDGSYVFLGEIILKNARDSNEDAVIKKRGGSIIKTKTEFLDLRMRDDTETIGTRINRFDFEKMGKHILNNVPEGAHLLIRAKFVLGIRFGFIQKYKILYEGKGK